MTDRHPMSDSWKQTRLDHRDRQSTSIAEAALTLLLEQGAPALRMSAIAEAAGVSRQTLYRYFPDIEAVLVGVAERLASHEEAFEADVLAQPDPPAQIERLVRTIVAVAEHGQDPSAFQASLPPEARSVLVGHEERVARLLAAVLTAGVELGAFRADLCAADDAPLILGLVGAADPEHPEQALTLVHRLIDPVPKEPPA